MANFYSIFACKDCDKIPLYPKDLIWNTQISEWLFSKNWIQEKYEFICPECSEKKILGI